MEHTRVRKIPSKPHPLPSEKWDDGWVRPILHQLKRPLNYLRELILENAAKVVFWSGLASTLGGLVWITLFLFVQFYMTIVYGDYYDSPFYDYYYNIASEFYRNMNVQLVLVPILLFLIALVGLYLYTRQQHESYSRYGWFGLKLSFAGIILVIIGRLILQWLSSATYEGLLNLSSLFQQEEQSDFQGFILLPLHTNILWPTTEVSSWYYAMMPGFLVLSAGLILYGVAAIKARILPKVGTLLLIISSMAVHVFPLAVDMLFPYDEAQRIYEGGVFTLLLVLFGMGWMWLGYVLWSTTPFMRSRYEDIRLGTHQ